jgi:hypothetical protein
MYSSPSKMFIFGFNDSIKTIESFEGVQQGCPLSTWAYSMALLPFITNISSILKTPLDGIVKAFVDDLIIAGQPDQMLQAIDYINSNGKYYGYSINFKKSKYLMGISHINQYHDFIHLLYLKGFLPETLLLHPSIPLINHIHNYNFEISPQQFHSSNFGIKLLGTYIGHNDYILIQIDKYITKLTTFAQKLIDFPHHQSRELMLMYSFCNKINHIFRTTNFNLLSELINKFQSFKQDLLLLTCNQSKFTNDIHYIQAMLPIRLGGLGLTDSTITAHSANIASFISCYHEINNHFQNIDFNLNNNYNYIHDSILFIKNNVSLENQSKYNFEQLITNYAQSSSTSLKLQNIFSTDMTENMQKNFIKTIETIPGCQYLTWYNSISNSSSGYFLFTSPKNNDLTFNNIEFSNALSLRLHLPLPIIPKNQCCSCKQHTLIDATGHHLITGCKEFGARQAHHKSLQKTLSKLLQYSGFKNTIEEHNCFTRLDPSNRQRPDISIHNPQSLGYETDLLLDISFVSPLTGTQNGNITNFSITQAKKKFRAADMRFHSKTKKYSENATINNKIFLPFIIETSGALHPIAEKLIKNIAKVGSATLSIPYNIMYNYMMKNISCTIQKSFVFRIFSRISNILIPNNIENLILMNINDNVDINIFNSNPHFNTSNL